MNSISSIKLLIINLVPEAISPRKYLFKCTVRQCQFGGEPDCGSAVNVRCAVMQRSCWLSLTLIVRIDMKV